MTIFIRIILGSFFLFFLIFAIFQFRLFQEQKRESSFGEAEVQDSPTKELETIMKDPRIWEKWGLKQVKAGDVWLNFSKGSKDVVVAVIDTGADVEHPDLKENIWTNLGEIAGNGKDDDGNGCIDDIHGWNFSDQTNKDKKSTNKIGCKWGNKDIRDIHGHGTHIAGIIGAVGNNGIGISGVAPKVSLMILKYYGAQYDGEYNLENTIEAIRYAIKNGADIINYSGGGPGSSEKEKRVLKEAERKGILVVVAAGNQGSNVDKKKYYPASYDLKNILAVTAVNKKKEFEGGWASKGKKYVGQAAPGSVDILSTLPGGKYGHMKGTSQSTAFATGAAVLVADYYKNKKAHFIIQQLKMTGDFRDSLKGKTNQSKSLNIYKAIATRGSKVNFIDQFVDYKGKIFIFREGKLFFVADPAPKIDKEIASTKEIMNLEKVKKTASISKERRDPAKILMRGREVNFMDEKVDYKGNIFLVKEGKMFVPREPTPSESNEFQSILEMLE